MIIIQQEIQQIICINKIIINLLVQIYLDIDLSRQTNTNTLQQINFIGKFKEGDGATIFFIADKLF